MEQRISTTTASRLLRVSKSTIQRQIKAGNLKAEMQKPRQVENRGDEGKQGRRQLRHEQHDSRQRSASAARYPRTAPLVRKPERAIHPSFCRRPCDIQGSLRRGRTDRAGKSPAGGHGAGRHPEQRRAGQDGGDGRAGGKDRRNEPDAAALARSVQDGRPCGHHGQGGAQGQGAEPDVLPVGAGLHRGADVRQSEVSADAGAGNEPPSRRNRNGGRRPLLLVRQTVRLHGVDPDSADREEEEFFG